MNNTPLAEKLRPKTLADFIGQEHILGEGKLLRRLIETDRIIPMIFWGPPGCGKTTIAKIIAELTGSYFVFFSAVIGGVADVRRIIGESQERLKENRKTILFVDEIHRFNKSQQDGFLPYVENGTIILLGATTENPSFEINAPLLSRAKVFHFRELSLENIQALLKSAVKKINSKPDEYFSHLKKNKISIEDDAAEKIANLCEGDIRDAYNSLEIAIITGKIENHKLSITKTEAEEAIQQKFIRYDKGADGHFDAISALNKSLRASDADASLHYLCRMLEAGEDPLYIVRRLVRFASEDIGLADPQALVLAVATQQAVHFIGMPEGGLALAEIAVYLAKAPKSRAIDEAYSAARNDVVNNRLDPIPLNIRNAQTKLMKDFGFGKGYQMYGKESHLPENLKDRKYWKD